MEQINEKHSIGKTIASLRKEKGWTQLDLARKLNVSDKAVSKWENDDSSPSIDSFPAIAELFNVSIDYIITGKISKDILAEKRALKAIHEGILCIDELLMIDNLEVIKNTLKKHPIHIIEVLLNLLNSNNLKELFEFAIDNDVFDLPYAIIKGEIKEIKSGIIFAYNREKYNMNLKHLHFNGIKLNQAICSTEYESVSSLLSFFNECKQRIIKELEE